jgi:hypothetical protein
VELPVPPVAVVYHTRLVPAAGVADNTVAVAPWQKLKLMVVAVGVVGALQLTVTRTRSDTVNFSALPVSETPTVRKLLPAKPLA